MPRTFHRTFNHTTRVHVFPRKTLKLPRTHALRLNKLNINPSHYCTCLHICTLHIAIRCNDSILSSALHTTFFSLRAVHNDHAHTTTSVGLLTLIPGIALHPLPPSSRIYLSCKAFCACRHLCAPKNTWIRAKPNFVRVFCADL
jgi:hypothetical protein